MAGTAPTPTLTTYQDQNLVSAADLNGLSTHLGTLFATTMAGFRNYKPFCATYLTATKAITSGGAGTLLTFDAETVDTDNIWSTAARNHFTINTAGWYRLTFQCHWDTNNTGQRVNRILANGTDANANAVATDNRAVLGLGEGTVTFCQCVAHLAAGALVYPFVTQNSGSTVNVNTAFSGTTFVVEWVAPY